MRQYDVMSIDSIQKLIAPVTKKNPNLKYYCAVDDLFELLSDVHKELQHGCRDRMKTEIDRKYKILERFGILKKLFARSQFTVCEEELLTKDELPSNKASLRTIATTQSVGDGQGMQKCYCKNKCDTNRCSCKRKNKLCTSRCHQSLSCCNK